MSSPIYKFGSRACDESDALVAFGVLDRYGCVVQRDYIDGKVTYTIDVARMPELVAGEGADRRGAPCMQLVIERDLDRAISKHRDSSPPKGTA